MQFMSFGSIYVFISINKTSLHEGNLRTESIESSGTQYSLTPCLDL